MTNTRKALYVVGGAAAIYGIYWLFKPVKSSADIYKEADVFTQANETGIIQLTDTERSNITDAFNSGVDALGNVIGAPRPNLDITANRLAGLSGALSSGGMPRASHDASIISTLTGDLRYSAPAPTVSERLGGRGTPGATF